MNIKCFLLSRIETISEVCCWFEPWHIRHWLLIFFFTTIKYHNCPIMLSRIVKPLLQSPTCSAPVPSCPHSFQLLSLYLPRMKLLFPLFLTLEFPLLFRSFSDKLKILSFNTHLLLRPWDQAQSVVDGLVPEDWKKASQFSNWAGKRIQGATSQPASPTFLPGKVIEWLVLEVISIHRDDKKGIRSTSLLPH